MWLNGIIAITNSNGDNVSPLNMFLWIFTSANLFFRLPTHLFFMISSMTFIVIIIIIIIISSLLRFFHTSVSYWFLTRVWLTASLLKFLGLFSVFWPISTMPLFGQSPPVTLFSRLLILVLILWWQLQLVLSSLWCSTVFQFPSKVEVLIYSHSFNFTLWSADTTKFAILQVLFFLFCFLFCRLL